MTPETDREVGIFFTGGSLCLGFAYVVFVPFPLKIAGLVALIIGSGLLGNFIGTPRPKQEKRAIRNE